MISKNIVTKVCQEIYAKFPQVAGCQPVIKEQGTHMHSNNNLSTHYLFIFTNSTNKEMNSPIKLWVRVNVDEVGRIIKISTSK